MSGVHECVCTKAGKRITDDQVSGSGMHAVGLVFDVAMKKQHTGGYHVLRKKNNTAKLWHASSFLVPLSFVPILSGHARAAHTHAVTYREL